MGSRFRPSRPLKHRLAPFRSTTTRLRRSPSCLPLMAAALNQLWGGPETVIAVSSDLSHFHSDETARRRDAATADMIERGAWTRLAAGNACGYLAIAGLLIEATRRGLNATRLWPESTKPPREEEEGASVTAPGGDDWLLGTTRDIGSLHSDL